MEIRHEITVGEAFANISAAAKRLEAALVIALQPLADYFAMEQMTLKEMARAMEMICKEYQEGMTKPLPHKSSVPRFRSYNLRVPKQTYFPKISATARSTC